MKKRLMAWFVFVALLLGLCGVAQAVTMNELQGVWLMDEADTLSIFEITPQQYQTQKHLIGDLWLTMEFTADNRCIFEYQYFNQLYTEEYTVILIGNGFTIDNGMTIIVPEISGNRMAFYYPDGSSLSMTRKQAGNNSSAYPVNPAPVPATQMTQSASIVGTWRVDFEATWDGANLPEAERARNRAIMGSDYALYYIFGADGVFKNVTYMDGQYLEPETTTYVLNGNRFNIGLDDVEFRIEGNRLYLYDINGNAIICERVE